MSQSKPIRRPQLKKVLKEFAPIPEEDEEVTPPDVLHTRGGSGSQNTTIVMVNGPGTIEDQAMAQRAADGVSPANGEAKPVHRSETNVGSPPISPLTST